MSETLAPTTPRRRWRKPPRLYEEVARDLAEAQDCVQEAYARAWQHWRRVGGYDDPEAWVRTVAWRLAADRWRNLRNARRALVRHGAPQPVPEPSPDNLALVNALRRIPMAQRQAIVLHHLCDKSFDEVANEVGVPVGTVKTRLARGRAAGNLSRRPALLFGKHREARNGRRGQSGRGRSVCGQ